MIYKNVCPASSCFPGTHYAESVSLLYEKGLTDNILKSFSFEHMQLCPQQKGVIDVELIDKFKRLYPDTKFRYHANVRLYPKIFFFDASSNLKSPDVIEYVERLGQAHYWLKPDVYSFHAGSKKAKFQEMISNVLYLQDFLKIPVAVEGLYPSRNDNWHLSSVKEYELLLKLDVFYAIDLSHIQIVANAEGVLPKDLIKELIESKRCLEIHVSDNDLVSDSHRQMKKSRWWMDILNEANIDKNAVIFCESDQRVREAFPK